MSVRVECRDVVKQVGEHLLINKLGWMISVGSRVGLLGQSGIGKTTLLRLIAGLEELTAGSIVFADRSGNTISRSKIRVSLLFQDLALWPHVTVRDHIRLVLPAKSDSSEISEILTHCQIPPSLWDRTPGFLSGGEAQRVAMARAIATRPDLLMIDEPFSNVDLSLQAEIKQCLRDYVEQREITLICVSHQWDDLVDMCQSVSVLDHGRIVQNGTLRDIYWNPLDRPVARITGSLIEFPSKWIESGFIHDPLGIYEKHWSRLGGIRPQAINLTNPEATNSWEVVSCCPRSKSWLVELKSAVGNVKCFANREVPLGEKVGVVITGQT